MLFDNMRHLIGRVYFVDQQRQCNLRPNWFEDFVHPGLDLRLANLDVMFSMFSLILRVEEDEKTLQKLLKNVTKNEKTT